MTNTSSIIPSKQQFIDALTQEQKILFGDNIDGIYNDFVRTNHRLNVQEYIDERVEVRKAMQKMEKLLDEPEVMDVFKRLKNK